MFVFVYPKDVELTDDNYMDYLAFWTGSLADAGEKERAFHGRTASNYTQRTPVENVSVLTDGWHMTAACNNAGSIIASTDASDYYVDVISTTDSSNGGMYRFKLVKEKKEKTQFTFRNLDTNAKTGKGGAVFELYKDGVHYSAQSENEEGRVTFNIVKPEGSDTDVYTLKETKAPEGYDKITTTWKVLVSSEGVTMVKDTEGNEMPKYPDGTYVVSSAKTDEADSTEQTAKTSSVIREYKSDDVNVTVTAENEADLPADAKLVVKPIELSQKAQENVEQAAIKEEKKAIKNILAYDIHFEADGKEVQPGATVKVSVDVPEIKAGANASVFHVDDKNKVENMDGEVDKKGNVVFETTHFSQYVIVNRSQTNKIKVTIHHYQYGTNNKIYADDVKTLDVGASISDYTKAKNWVVEQVILNGAVQSNTDFNLTSDSTIDVYYYPTSKPIETEVAFYDYTLKAGQVNSSMDYSKTATVIDWDKRTYKIDINASSKATSSSVTEKTGAADIMMVFDMSGSMNEEGTKKNQGKFDVKEKQLDKTKVYYYNTSGRESTVSKNTYYTNPMIYIDGAWRYYNGSEWKEPTNRDVLTIYGWSYGQVSTWNSRITALKEAAIAFIKDTAKKSPESKIGIATFDGYWQSSTRGNLIQSIQEVGSQTSEMIKNICKITADGGTSPQKGLEKAKEQLNSEAVKDDKLPKNIILFTDGVPSYEDDTEKTETIIGTLKNEATIFTVALSSNNEKVPGSDKTNVEWMKGLATDEKHAFSVSDSSELGNIFQTITETITQNINIENATIIDVIDPRFVILDHNGNPITEDGTELNDGIVKFQPDENGNITKKGYQYITWTNQTIKHSSSNGATTTPGWSNTITVKAKDEYIGGNNIPTNISPASKIITGYGEAILPQPKVNVKADLLVNNTERTIFLGENTPYSDVLLKELFDTDNPQGYVDGVLKPYTMGSDGKAIKPEDFSIQWYSDTECKKPLPLPLDQIRKDKPDSTKEYYLKVTYDKIGEASEDSNTNTTITTIKDGKPTDTVHSNDEKISAHNSADDKARTYGVYKVNVKTGTIDITKKLLSDVDYVTSNNASFNFIVQKIKDADGKAILPAENIGQYSISFDVKDGKVIAQKLTKKEGSADLTKLPKGMYTVTEDLSSETKYEFKDGKILSNGTTCEYKLSGDHKIATFAIGYKNYNTAGDGEGLDNDQGKVIFTNQRLSSIQINKIGEKDEEGKDKLLKGARFEIAKKDKDNKYVKVQNVGTDENGNNVDYIETAANGEASFNDLPEGDYQITEIQSPAGYTLLANPIEVSLPYVITDSSKTDIVPTDNKKVNYNDVDHYYEITYTIKNNKLFNMPASGGRFKATLIGIAVMIMAAGCYILRHRRKRII